MRVREPRAEGVHVLAEEELGRGVHGEPRGKILDVDGEALAQARFELAECFSGVSVEDVEVADAVFVEERACHCAVEPDIIEVCLEICRWDGDLGEGLTSTFHLD